MAPLNDYTRLRQGASTDAMPKNNVRDSLVLDKVTTASDIADGTRCPESKYNSTLFR